MFSIYMPLRHEMRLNYFWDHRHANRRDQRRKESPTKCKQAGLRGEGKIS